MGKYRVILSERAKKDLLNIQKSGDRASIKKIEIIISELYTHPETGTGKPERLKFDLAGYWSRRINKKDRLIYSIEEILSRSLSFLPLFIIAINNPFRIEHPKSETP